MADTERTIDVNNGRITEGFDINNNPLVQAFIAHGAREISVGNRETLFESGDIPKEILYLLEGRIALRKSDKDNFPERHPQENERYMITDFVKPGEIVDMSAVYGEPHSVSALSLSRSRMLALPYEEFYLLMKQDPRIVKYLHSQVSSALTNAVGHSQFLSNGIARQRTAKTILTFADNYGVAHGLTQEDMAGWAGLGRETFNKTLANFAGRGIVNLARKSVQVIDPARLTAIAHPRATRRIGKKSGK